MKQLKKLKNLNSTQHLNNKKSFTEKLIIHNNSVHIKHILPKEIQFEDNLPRLRTKLKKFIIQTCYYKVEEFWKDKEEIYLILTMRL